MVKKTFKELRNIDVVVGALFQKNPKVEEGKFGYWWKKFMDKNYIEHLKQFQHQINDVRIDYALEDKTTKEILRDPLNPRGFRYTKDGLKKVIEKENEITEEWDKKEVEVEPYFVPEESLPEMSYAQREALEGVLVEPKAE